MADELKIREVTVLVDGNGVVAFRGLPQSRSDIERWGREARQWSHGVALVESLIRDLEQRWNSVTAVHEQNAEYEL